MNGHEKLLIVKEDNGMGIKIHSNIYNVKEYTIKNPEGGVAGTIRITKSARKKPKRLQYNFKYISSKILMSKTSNSAGKALVTARVNVGVLYRKLYAGFDDDEVKLAIIHAKKIERIARKKLKHLQEEEHAKQKGSCQDKIVENGISDLEDSREEKAHEISEEELKKRMDELKKLMEETMQETMQETIEQTVDELIGSVYRDMDENDLERLKKKNRANELQEIMEADLKYLKALFHKLQREKEEASKGNVIVGSEGVSMEVSGVEMPVQASETPIITEGGSIDLSI